MTLFDNKATPLQPPRRPPSESMVLLRRQDGQTFTLSAGDRIGRAADAELRLDQMGVCDTHAIVSSRPRGLVLKALVGALALRGQFLHECRLIDGQTFELAAGVTLEVVRVHNVLPDDDYGDTTHNLRLPVRLRLTEDAVHLTGFGLGTAIAITGPEATLIEVLADSRDEVHWSVAAELMFPTPDALGSEQDAGAAFHASKTRLVDVLEKHGLHGLIRSRDDDYRLAMVEGDELLDERAHSLVGHVLVEKWSTTTTVVGLPPRVSANPGKSASGAIAVAVAAACVLAMFAIATLTTGVGFASSAWAQTAPPSVPHVDAGVRLP